MNNFNYTPEITDFVRNNFCKETNNRTSRHKYTLIVGISVNTSKKWNQKPEYKEELKELSRILKISFGACVVFAANNIHKMPICLICSTSVEVKVGGEYNIVCCRKCSGIYTQRERRKDEEKFRIFKERCSAAAQKGWDDRSDQEKREIFERAGRTNSENISKLSDEERIAKYNHNPNGNIHVLRQWYQSADDGTLNSLYKIRGDAIRKHDYSREEFGGYSKEVRLLTNRVLRNYPDMILGNENIDKISIDGYHLDHRVSIVECFQNNIPIELAASPYNLEVIPAKENLRKNYKSSISIQELLENAKPLYAG